MSQRELMSENGDYSGLNEFRSAKEYDIEVSSSAAASYTESHSRTLFSSDSGANNLSEEKEV